MMYKNYLYRTDDSIITVGPLRACSSGCDRTWAQSDCGMALIAYCRDSLLNLERNNLKKAPLSDRDFLDSVASPVLPFEAEPSTARTGSGDVRELAEQLAL